VILSRAQALVADSVAFAIHNAEEAVMFPSCLPRVIERLPEAFQPMIADIPSANLRVALLGATLVPFVLLVWATVPAELGGGSLERPGPCSASSRSTFLSHVTVARCSCGDNSPGLLSAIFIKRADVDLPPSRAARERWLPGSAARMLLPTARFSFTPGLFGVLLLSGAGTDAGFTVTGPRADRSSIRAALPGSISPARPAEGGRSTSAR